MDALIMNVPPPWTSLVPQLQSACEKGSCNIVYELFQWNSIIAYVTVYTPFYAKSLHLNSKARLVLPSKVTALHSLSFALLLTLESRSSAFERSANFT